jgi:putative ABC transport system permease protein
LVVIAVIVVLVCGGAPANQRRSSSMLKKDLLLMANRNLWRRRARTVLTCLGVLIGTASIVVMLSLGIGLKESMEKNMAQWGSLNIIRVHPGMQWDPEGNTSGEERRLNDETVAELKAIQRCCHRFPHLPDTR